MACHEIGALRLALMNILGRDDDSERQHELAELGPAADQPGPISSLMRAGDLDSLKRFYDAAIAKLEERVATTAADDPQLPYLKTLIILTKKVELELENQIEGFSRLYRNLEDMHDFVHEIYPGS
ncbi:MAG: DUF3209 family protein [Proteobacteria bacterium]|nr:DUF3209 family protein [Pseudomonadota bacterium]